MFEQSGYQAASIDDIAEAAGVARRTIYHHFKTKHDILVAASLEQAHLFLQELKQAVQPGEDFPAFIIDCLCHVIEKAPASKFFMLQSARGAAIESASVYFSHPALSREWMDFLRGPYDEARRRHQINPALTLEAVANWFGRIATSFLQYPLRGDLRQVLTVFVGGGLRFGHS